MYEDNNTVMNRPTNQHKAEWLWNNNIPLVTATNNGAPLPWSSWCKGRDVTCMPLDEYQNHSYRCWCSHCSIEVTAHVICYDMSQIWQSMEHCSYSLFKDEYQNSSYQCWCSGCGIKVTSQGMFLSINIVVESWQCTLVINALLGTTTALQL